MNRKKINYQNGISYLLTNSEKSYDQLADKLTSYLQIFNNDSYFTKRRVENIAHGTIPFGPELDALCLLKYINDNHLDKAIIKNKPNKIRLLQDKANSKWKELYFPNTTFTKEFIRQNISEEIKKLFKNNKIDTFIYQRSLSSLYVGLVDKDVPLKVLAGILSTQIYLKVRNNDLIDDKENIDISCKDYKKQIIPTFHKLLDQIDINSFFMQNLTQKLKDVLVRDGTNRANINRIALKEVISILF
ncbi:hypothetical protein [Lactobacillus johnsonii]|uniref:hypothetical protein n=1 Tax=Lactobacillus johnsonii TaxID=33959 RepID=UPI00364A3832